VGEVRTGQLQAIFDKEEERKKRKKEKKKKKGKKKKKKSDHASIRKWNPLITGEIVLRSVRGGTNGLGRNILRQVPYHWATWPVDRQRKEISHIYKPLNGGNSKLGAPEDRPSSSRPGWPRSWIAAINQTNDDEKSWEVQSI